MIPKKTLSLLFLLSVFLSLISGTVSALSCDTIGIGYMNAIGLKDEYRDDILPLAYTAGAKYTLVYLTRDWRLFTSSGACEDGSFFDINVFPFDNYDAGDDFNSEWWNRFDVFLREAESYDITVVPTLFDFCCSEGVPFGGFNNFDSIDERYVSRVVDYLDGSGVDYIINIGCESNDEGILSSDFVNDCMEYLHNSKGVSYGEMVVSDEIYREDFSGEITHTPGYITDHGSAIPNDNDEMNDEERMGGGGYPSVCNDDCGDGSGWGGSGTVSQYRNYLNSVSNNGIAVMNFWHLGAYNNCNEASGGEDMNNIFAPNQRQAMIDLCGAVDPCPGQYESTDDIFYHVDWPQELSWADGGTIVCCDHENSCVSDSGTCYQSATTIWGAPYLVSGLNPYGNDNYAFCFGNLGLDGGAGWLDCDYNNWYTNWCNDANNICGNSSGVLAGESGVGEYEDTTTLECCGDDSGEYFVTACCSGTCEARCCNSATDEIDDSGNCVSSCPFNPGDINRNGVVDLEDLTIIGNNFGLSPPLNGRADANSDGICNIYDLVLVAKNWGFGT